jgi:hypothetical protein
LMDTESEVPVSVNDMMNGYVGEVGALYCKLVDVRRLYVNGANLGSVRTGDIVK